MQTVKDILAITFLIVVYINAVCASVVLEKIAPSMHKKLYSQWFDFDMTISEE